MTSTQRTDDTDRTLPQQRRPAPPAPPEPTVQTPRRPARGDIIAIQASLAAVRKRPVALAEAFYRHLFAMAPGTRPLFGDDLTVQMQRMIDVLLATIGTLEDPADQAALERSLQVLGVRHCNHFNVHPEHYRYFAHALTRAVRDVAGPAWTGSLSSSWIGLTLWITGHMLIGHHRHAPEH